MATEDYHRETIRELRREREACALYLEHEAGEWRPGETRDELYLMAKEIRQGCHHSELAEHRTGAA